MKPVVVQLQSGFRTEPSSFKVPTSTLVLYSRTHFWLVPPCPGYSTVKGLYLFLVYFFLRPSEKVQLLFYWLITLYQLLFLNNFNPLEFLDWVQSMITNITIIFVKWVIKSCLNNCQGFHYFLNDEKSSVRGCFSHFSFNWSLV